ncbi:Palmitoyl-protein thioesterase 1 [Sorochytrium milnesiophthora]
MAAAAAEISDTARAEAEALKAEANKLFADHHFELAIKKYDEAIDVNPNVPAYYTNRAFAYIKTEAFAFAVRLEFAPQMLIPSGLTIPHRDAEKAVEIDPTYAKAYYRRAVAHMAMLHFKEALKDLRTVVKYQPRDPDAKKKLDECTKIVKKIEFEKAIASEDKVKKTLAERIGDLNNIIVEDSYTGPRLSDSGENGGMTAEFVEQMVEHFRKEKRLHRKYAYKILLAARTMFEQLPSLVDVETPENGRLTVCGDTHGQFYDLLNIFKLNGAPSPTNAYVFNGDFVDRGNYSCEVIFTLLAYKLLYPHAMHLSRGNHETEDMNKMYGFEGEVKSKFNDTTFAAFTEVFNAMPLAIVINTKFLVVHGGLFSKDGVTLDDIRAIDRFKQPENNGLMCELLWADPWDKPGRGPSKRGVGLQFGPDVTAAFLENNNLDMLIRSHEVKEGGYEVAHNGKCVTVFSAPNYCDSVGNRGAYIVIGRDNKVEYKQFEAVPHPKGGPMRYASMFGAGGGGLSM